MGGKSNGSLGGQWRVESSRANWSQDQIVVRRSVHSQHCHTFPCTEVSDNTGVRTSPKLLMRKQTQGREVTYLTLQGWDLKPRLPACEAPAFCVTPSRFPQTR